MAQLRIKRFLQYFLPTLSSFIIAGIVGNRADSLLINLIPIASQSVSVKIWLFVIFFLLLIAPLLWAVLRLRKAHQIATTFNELDDTLIRLLKEFRKEVQKSSSSIRGSATTTNKEEVLLKRLVEEVLERILDLFLLYCNHCSVEIFIKDPSDPDYLVSWCYNNTTSDSQQHGARIFVGSVDPTKNGLRGRVFLEGKASVAHINKEGSEWRAQESDFIFINNSNKKTRFPFRTMIAAPISGSVPDQNFGVLCLYSLERRAFDSTDLKNLLLSVANRIASALVICD
jgi:GAF domain